MKPKNYPREQKEKAILVGVISTRPNAPQHYSEPLEELARLAETAGVEIVGKVVQNRRDIHQATYVGKGKVQEIKLAIEELQANVVIVDDDLSPSQGKKLTELTECKVIDRTELILDIFAKGARTYEAKLQVELAQLQYAMPRLTRLWEHLDRYSGGIGTKGPGEKQLETDKRLIRDQIYQVAAQLDNIQKNKTREVMIRKEKFLTVAIVGYTNAGKSTLMNALTDAGVLVENRLFSTLDTRTRVWQLAQGRKVMLSDTVGFIEKLPHHLVASFKATLEEASQADLLLHVVDVANPDAQQQIAVVQEILESIRLHEKPQLIVFNKIDAVTDQSDVANLYRLHPRHVKISAKLGRFLDQLGATVLDALEATLIDRKLVVPISSGRLIAWLEEHARILEKSCTEREIVYLARLAPAHAAWIEQELVQEEQTAPQQPRADRE